MPNAVYRASSPASILNAPELRNSKDPGEFNANLHLVLNQFESNEIFKADLNKLISNLLHQVSFVNAFSDYGISSNRGLFQELYSRIKHKILPPKTRPEELRFATDKLITSRKSRLLLTWIDETNWKKLISLAGPVEISKSAKEKIELDLLNAIVILSHRFTNIGLDPYFSKRMPEIDDLDSPFFQFNRQVNNYNESTHPDFSDRSQQCKLLLETLSSCEKIILRMEENEKKNGTSIHQIFLTKLSLQQIERLRFLIQLYESADAEHVVVKFLPTLTAATLETRSLIAFFKQNTQLLAYRSVNHTSEKGEHYIGFNKEENKRLFRSALGGGFIVVFLVLFKHIIHGWHLSLFFEGLFFGLNYAFGFILMHLMHFTLATKQPAMTASYLASTMNTDSKESRQAFRKVIGSQFISLIGNLVVVLPLCFLLAFGFLYFFDNPLFDQKEAEKALYSNHPLLSLSLFYAIITACFLSLSGIITGLIDNKIQYSEITDRIKGHPFLQSRFTTEKRTKIALFIEKNGGAICGNLFLGLALGMMGNIGQFFGLPLDIRHITISAGNFGMSAGSGWDFSISLLITVFVGVILIGLINIIASFLISFVLACASQGISFKKAISVLGNYLGIRTKS